MNNTIPTPEQYRQKALELDLAMHRIDRKELPCLIETEKPYSSDGILLPKLFEMSEMDEVALWPSEKEDVFRFVYRKKGEEKLRFAYVQAVYDLKVRISQPTIIQMQARIIPQKNKQEQKPFMHKQFFYQQI